MTIKRDANGELESAKSWSHYESFETALGDIRRSRGIRERLEAGDCHLEAPSDQFEKLVDRYPELRMMAN